MSAEKVIRAADKIIECHFGQKRRPGSRQNLCVDSAAIVGVVAEHGGVKAKIIEIGRVNRLLGVPSDQSFHGHEAVILGETYLVDLAFCQFVNPQNGQISYQSFEERRVETGIDYRKNPTAKNMIKEGYIRIVELPEYLKLTVSPEAKNIISGKDMKSVMRVLDNFSNGVNIPRLREKALGIIQKHVEEFEGADSDLTKLPIVKSEVKLR